MTKEEKILAVINKIYDAEIVRWETYINHDYINKKDEEFMCILLEFGNHHTLMAEDLEIINSFKPRSIVLYTDKTNQFIIDGDENRIYLDVEIKIG